MKKSRDKNAFFNEGTFVTAGTPLFDFAAGKEPKPVNGHKKPEPLPEVVKVPGISEQFKKCNACLHKQTIPVDSPNWCRRYKKRPAVAECAGFESGESQPETPVCISSYSRAQAIEDGELVDVTAIAKEAGFSIPVAVTRAVWSGCVEVPPGVEGQDEQGRLWDILMCAWRAAHKGGEEIRFKVKMRLKKGYRLVEFKAICGPGDDQNPVVTIMEPAED